MGPVETRLTLSTINISPVIVEFSIDSKKVICIIEPSKSTTKPVEVVILTASTLKSPAFDISSELALAIKQHFLPLVFQTLQQTLVCKMGLVV